MKLGCLVGLCSSSGGGIERERESDDASAKEEEMD